jgi:hypothetical protein
MDGRKHFDAFFTIVERFFAIMLFNPDRNIGGKGSRGAAVATTMRRLCFQVCRLLRFDALMSAVGERGSSFFREMMSDRVFCRPCLVVLAGNNDGCMKAYSRDKIFIVMERNFHSDENKFS